MRKRKTEYEENGEGVLMDSFFYIFANSTIPFME